MRKALTSLALDKAKPRAKSYKMGDGAGLFVLVRPNGSKYWRFKYRWGGKEKQVALGVYPQVGLADARRELAQLRAELEQGHDPAAMRAVRKATRTLDAANTLAAISREWMRIHRDEWSDSHATKMRSRLERHVFPRLGHRPVRDISVQEVLVCLRAIEASGKLETAKRARSHMACIFRHALITGRCDTNPAVDLTGVMRVPVARSFPTITDPVRVGELLRAIERYEGWFSTKALLRLSPMLFQRPGEIRNMTWAEVDLDQALWTIPAVRMKRRKAGKLHGAPHLVPLARQAIAILGDLQLMSGAHAYVFPSLARPKAPLSTATVAKALEKMGFKGALVPHGFRHMADTLLHELGWSDAAIERQLAHVEPNKVRRTYNRAKYLPERRRMMQAWADYLIRLRDGADIVPLASQGR